MQTTITLQPPLRPELLRVGDKLRHVTRHDGGEYYLNLENENFMQKQASISKLHYTTPVDIKACVILLHTTPKDIVECVCRHRFCDFKTDHQIMKLLALKKPYYLLTSQKKSSITPRPIVVKSCWSRSTTSLYNTQYPFQTNWPLDIHLHITTPLLC